MVSNNPSKDTAAPVSETVSATNVQSSVSSNGQSNTTSMSDVSTTVRSTSDNNYGITLPIAPEGIQVFPTPTVGGNTGNGSSSGNNDYDYGITTPVAPEGGAPVYPGNTSSGGSSSGGSSSGGNNSMWPTFPWFPTCPGCGTCGNCNWGNNPGSGNTSGGSSGTQFGMVRFLNASTNNTSVSITFDNTTYATNVEFGTITNYRPILDGFHTVSVRRTTGLQALVVQQSFPFSAGQKYTLVLVDSAAGGVNLIQISDTGCSNLSSNTGCYRVANMAYSGSSFDVFLYSHDAIFRNVAFEDVASYKQAIAGTYQFYITNSSNISLLQNIPVLIIGATNNGISLNDPLVSYSVDIAAGHNYTSYLIGSSWSDMGFRVLTVQD